MKSLLLAILVLGTMFGEDTPKPKFTDPVVSKYTKSIEDIDLKATKEKREVRNKAVNALDASIKRAMSAGDLDKAVWLREEKTRISKEWIPSDGELIGEKPMANAKKMVIGKWKQFKGNHIFVFMENDSFTFNGSSSADWAGKKWEIVDLLLTMNANCGQVVQWKFENNEFIRVGDPNDKLIKIK